MYYDEFKKIFDLLIFGTDGSNRIHNSQELPGSYQSTGTLFELIELFMKERNKLISDLGDTVGCSIGESISAGCKELSEAIIYLADNLK